jgi:hypothetical protein
VGFILFREVEPEVAERETRTATVLQTLDDLPADDYVLMESYCPDPACDCRRVMLNVAGREQTKEGWLATISFGLDRDEEMAGPFLDPLNPQSEYSGALLQVIEDVVLADRWYVERLEEHYQLVKRAAEDFGHPAYAKIQEELHRSDNELAFSSGPRKKRVPRNAPCPCGSGKKYKQCCMWRDRWG